jgi:hypothetical protein
MWSVIPSLETILQGLLGAFTQPSAATFLQVFVGWAMCLGRRTEFRVFEAIGGKPISRRKRHAFDRFYNFFSRSAWTVRDLAARVALQVVVTLNRTGVLHLVVDATLLHKSGKRVYAIGWFHDAVRSTKKRVATSLGNQWVVLGLAIRIPGLSRVFCLPIHALLQKPGKGQPGPAQLARQMLRDVLEWFPDRRFVLIGDGGFSGKPLLRDLDQRITYVGLMRGDAALHDPRIPRRRRGARGPKPKYGPRLLAPRQAARKADAGSSRWRWTTIQVVAYGATQKFLVCAYQAVWPKVFGTRPIQVVLCHPLDKRYKEVYLYTTDLTASPAWVVEMYASRTSIEAAFKDSKQVMEIKKPQHWCRASIEKLAPWVWLTQSLVAVWYFTQGHKLPEARAARRQLGAWDTEWSLRHMLRILRRATLRATIQLTSPKKHDLQQSLEALENYLTLAA